MPPDNKRPKLEANEPKVVRTDARLRLLSLLDPELIRACKRADDLLQQSQARLELAQAITHLGSWELDLATGKGVWSQEMYRLFQRDPTTHPPIFDESAT